MKITLTFKHPDVLDQVDDQIEDEGYRKQAKAICSQWLEYDEYIRVEVDTDTATCTVVEP